MGTQKSVYLALQGNEEFSEFLNLIDNDGAALLNTTLNQTYRAGLAAQGSKNLTLLDNYNYTIYVPTNASIRKLVDDGLLPTWEDYENADDICKEMGLPTDEASVEAVRTKIKNIIVDFVRYHVQDHSVAVNMAPEDGSYVSAYESMKRNPETGRFYPLVSDNSGHQLSVTDNMGNVRHVNIKEGLYNQICREYWFNVSGTGGLNTKIFMCSDAVVHQIDGPLFYENMTPWREVIKN